MTIPAQDNVYNTLHLESTKQGEVVYICQMQYLIAFQNEITVKEKNSCSLLKQSSESGLDLLKTTWWFLQYIDTLAYGLNPY